MHFAILSKPRPPTHLILVIGPPSDPTHGGNSFDAVLARHLVSLWTFPCKIPDLKIAKLKFNINVDDEAMMLMMMMMMML